MEELKLLYPDRWQSEVFTKSIYSYPFSKRTKLVLLEQDIHYFGQLVLKTEQEFLQQARTGIGVRLRGGIGKITIDQIKNALNSLNLHFKGEVDSQ